MAWWNCPAKWMDNHFPDPRKITQKKGKIQLVEMWWITPLRRWISSPGKNSTGYDYGQISGCFHPLTHPFREGIFTFLEGFFLPKSRWFLFFFNSCKGQKFYFKWIVFHQISSPQWLKYRMIFPTWEFHSACLLELVQTRKEDC